MIRTMVIAVLLTVFFLGCQETLLGPEPDNTPKSIVAILWKAFDENYALFPVKNVNWDSLRTAYDSRISAAQTEDDVWNICTDLLSHLDDGHVDLLGKRVSRLYNSSHNAARKNNDFSLALVKSTYLNGVKSAGAGYFTYGRINQGFTSKSIGYIHLSTFASSGSGNGVDWAYDVDKAVQELYGCDGLILDLRNNGGGLKVTVEIIVSAFLDRSITYFYQREKTGPRHTDFGEPMALSASPREGVLRYTKHIALLTNRLSASGSEHFTQAFRYLPYATQIGDTTFGCFGDIIQTGQLPNGWSYMYPCRLTTTPEGKCYEGIGMIPDILVTNTRADIDAGRDNVIIRAINYLSQ